VVRATAVRVGGVTGNSTTNQNTFRAEDPEGRKKLAGYVLRAPIALQKMTYGAETGTVIYRSTMHAGLKRNFQVMPGAEWLELPLRHIPDRYEHLVRYVGWYSNRARGERANPIGLPVLSGFTGTLAFGSISKQLKEKPPVRPHCNSVLRGSQRVCRV
jgi:hypothetical protein